MKQFAISKKEKNGLFALGCVIVSVILLNLINCDKSNKIATIKYAEATTSTDQNSNLRNRINIENAKSPRTKAKSKEIIKKSYFDFDPNNLDAVSAKKLGISEYAYRNLSNYISKGGRISSAEKFSKIYGINPELFESLKPYIKIIISQGQSETSNETSKTNVVKVKYPKKEIQANSIEINSAVLEDFEALNGIGNILASRIVKYRNSLGGYISVDQLREVYGMQDSTFNNIKDKLTCNGMINKININAASDSILSKHPYISKQEAKVIKKYLHQHDSIEDINQLKSIMSLDKAKLDKMSKYLAVN